MGKIKDHLPVAIKRPEVLKMAQGRVPLELWTAVNQKLIKEGVRWQELIEACLKAYLEEK